MAMVGTWRYGMLGVNDSGMDNSMSRKRQSIFLFSYPIILDMQQERLVHFAFSSAARRRLFFASSAVALPGISLLRRSGLVLAWHDNIVHEGADDVLEAARPLE